MEKGIHPGIERLAQAEVAPRQAREQRLKREGILISKGVSSISELSAQADTMAGIYHPDSIRPLMPTELQPVLKGVKKVILEGSGRMLYLE